jgi:hypothetical protein
MAQSREAFVAGRDNKVVGQYGSAFGRQNIAGYACLASGRKNTILREGSLGCGQNNISEAAYSHVSGYGNKITEAAKYGFAHGYGPNVLDAWGGVMFGSDNSMNRTSERADQVGKELVGGFIFGNGNTITHHFGVCFGAGNKNHGEATFINGVDMTANKGSDYGFGSGISCRLNGLNSNVIGTYLIGNANQLVIGRYNAEDTNAAFIIGDGTEIARSNALTVTKDSGNVWTKGTVETNAIILRSSTPGSTKKFKLTIDDNGTLSTTEVE